MDLRDLEIGMPVRATEAYRKQLDRRTQDRRKRGVVKKIAHGFVRVKWDDVVRPETLHPDFVERG